MSHTFSSLSKSWRKNKGFLIINITGLAIGLTVSILLLIYVMNEWSYDRHFTNKDNIVQLNTVWNEEGRSNVQPICTRTAYTELPQNIPGIEKAVQFYRGFDVEVIHKPERFQKVNLLYSDPEFFDLFNMKFVYGSADNALLNPYSAVLTRQQSEAIYGNINPVGQTFTIEDAEFTVTAVVEKLPVNTHFNFDILASMKSVSYLNQMDGLEFFTYFLLDKNMPKEQVNQLIQKNYTALLTKNFSSFNVKFESFALPLTRIHLFSKASWGLSAPGSLQSVFMLIGLAFLILLLAITNFVNLFVVQGNSRSSEVGIRKTNGAGKREIARQFFSEASTVVLIAFAIGIILSIMLLPSFSSLINKEIEASLFYNPIFILGTIVLILFTTLLSASYPAFYLSRFKPVEILKKTGSAPSRKRFTTSIIVFQSVITIVLIAVMLIVTKQTNYLKSIPLGFNPQNVMVIFNPNDQLISHYDALKQDLQKIPGITRVSAAQHIIGEGTSGQGILRFGDNSNDYKTINEYRISSGLCELMEFKLSDGKYFKENDPANKNSVVLNKEAVKMLNLKNPVGEKVVMHGNPMEVIGVVENFYYNSTAWQISPIVLTSAFDRPRYFYIRFDSNINKAHAAQLVLPVFHKFDPEFILNSTWSEDIYNGKFAGEKKMAKIIFTSTLLSLFIAILGLFAIHSFIIAQRIKEIGIRKVSGSSTWSVVALLTGKVLLEIGISAAIAIPIALYFGNSWLHNYSNRISIGVFLVLIPVIIHAAIALITTITVSYKAASRNPVESLRYE
jgi:putative ABC transport system permease protein